MKLFLKAALFTAVVPGTVAGLVPLLLKGDRVAAGGATLGLAVCLFALGIGLYLRCVRDFAVAGGGTPAPIDAPKRLVTNGVYRHSRNPIYIAELAVIGAWASLFEAPGLVAYGVVLFVVLSLAVRRYEEPRLARQFGDQYAAYAEATGRWLPRLRRKVRP